MPLLLQKVFWDVVKTMISNGQTSDSVIDQIFLVYGRGKSNSNILSNSLEWTRKQVFLNFHLR